MYLIRKNNITVLKLFPMITIKLSVAQVVDIETQRKREVYVNITTPKKSVIYITTSKML